MKYLHHIPFASRLDLLDKAIESIRPLWPHTSIIDNTPHGTLSIRQPIPILRVPTPLSWPQLMNFMQRRAIDEGADAWGYQHPDCEAQKGTAEKFLEEVGKAVSDGENWGVGFTCYDMLSFYNPRMVKLVGPWDTNMPQRNYTSDVDWFHRLNLLKIKRIETRLPVVHMDGGSTTHKTPGRKQPHDATFGLNADYYQKKWGGEIRKEVFERPWNWYPVKVFGESVPDVVRVQEIISFYYAVEVLSEKQTGDSRSPLIEDEWTQYANFVVCGSGQDSKWSGLPFNRTGILRREDLTDPKPALDALAQRFGWKPK